jgi:hypothetical protein
MKTIRTIAVSLATTLVALASVPLLAQAQWDVTKTLHIGGEGGWDYVTVDAPTHRLFITRGTHTMVVDAVTGKTLGDVPVVQRWFLSLGADSSAMAAAVVRLSSSI